MAKPTYLARPRVLALGSTFPTFKRIEFTAGFTTLPTLAFFTAQLETRNVIQERNGTNLLDLIWKIDGAVVPPRDEVAPFHSLTSSARAMSEGDTVRPSALAVLRLITSSILFGRSTGRSPGLAPFKILSTKTAARR